MNRRVFIKNAALASLIPFIGSAVSCHRSAERQKIIVLIQLIGGNDGLNTLIPLDNYERIIKARPNIYIPEKKTLPLKGVSTSGLHPAMSGIKDLYDNDMVSFIQNVGYENPNFSHFRSSDIWMTGASSNQVLLTGWMARYLQATTFKNYPSGFPNAQHRDPPAVKIGDTGTMICLGDSMDMSIVIDPASISEDQDFNILTTGSPSDPISEVEGIRQILLQTQKYSKPIKDAARTSFSHANQYPKAGENSLADQLKVVAKLINGGSQTSVYIVDFKGFDTHDAQVDPTDTTKGNHADQLKKLSQAITCFWSDVTRMGREKDVIGMTFSEFGRRIMSNGSHGTDHGAAQPVMLFGASVQHGIIGKNPSIPDQVTPGDNLSAEYDFKAVYSSVLKKWFDAPDQIVQKILPGKYTDIPLIKTAKT